MNKFYGFGEFVRAVVTDPLKRVGLEDAEALKNLLAPRTGPNSCRRGLLELVAKHAEGGLECLMIMEASGYLPGPMQQKKCNYFCTVDQESFLAHRGEPSGVPGTSLEIVPIYLTLVAASFAAVHGPDIYRRMGPNGPELYLDRPRPKVMPEGAICWFVVGPRKVHNEDGSIDVIDTLIEWHVGSPYLPLVDPVSKVEMMNTYTGVHLYRD